MVEQGPTVAFHLLEVCTHPLGTEGVCANLLGVKCSNTSPKNIDAYVRKSAYFGKCGKCGNCRTGSYCSISSPGGLHTPPRHRGGVYNPPGDEILRYKSQNYCRICEKKCLVRQMRQWQNRVLLQHFISWKFAHTPSAQRGCVQTSRG
jgi:hypothetical protein